MPKIPVEDADLGAKARTAFEFELTLAQIRTALSAKDVERAVQLYAAAVDSHGDDFLQDLRQRLPAKLRATFDDVVKLAAGRHKPGN
jgi:hypothetical protein